MRAFFFLTLITVVALSSCSDVHFKTAQPKGVEQQPTFPQELLGEYVSLDKETDSVHTTLNISKGWFELKGKLQMKAGLSDTVILKQFDKYYFLNLKDLDYESWQLIYFKASKSKIKAYMIADVKDDVLAELNKITKVSTFKDKDSEDVDHYLIDPSKEELLKIMNIQLYEGTMEFERSE